MAPKDDERELLKDTAQFAAYWFHYVASYYQQLLAKIFLIVPLLLIATNIQISSEQLSPLANSGGLVL